MNSMSEEVVNEIMKRFHKEGLNITLDKKDLGYRESITKFMEKLGQADAIILVISNKYLHSEYCMFELLQIYDNKNILERIFPVVLEEVNIAKSADRIELVKYWEDQSKELENKIRELQSLSNIEGIGEDLNLYYNIRSKIAKLTSILKDINTLNIHAHKDSDYMDLVQSVKKQLAKKKSDQPGEVNFENKITSVVNNEVISTINNTSAIDTSNSAKMMKWLVAFSLLFILGFVGKEFIFSERKNTTSETSIPEPENMVIDSKTENIPTEEKGNISTGKSDKVAKDNALDNKIAATQYSPQSDDENKQNANETERPAIKPVLEEIKDIPIKNEIKEESSIKTKKWVSIESQNIEVEFAEDISSNTIQKGNIIYLINRTEIKSESEIVIKKGASIKAIVNDAKSSINGSLGVLSISIQSVKAINGEWLPLQYPTYSKKERKEIIFKKGQLIPKVKLNSFNIQI